MMPHEIYHRFVLAAWIKTEGRDARHQTGTWELRVRLWVVAGDRFCLFWLFALVNIQLLIGVNYLFA